MEIKMLLILCFVVLAGSQDVHLPNFKWESYRVHKWHTVSPLLMSYPERIPTPPTEFSFPDLPPIRFPVDDHPDLKHEEGMIPSGESFYDSPMIPIVYVDVERERYGGFGGTGDDRGYGAYKSKLGVKPDSYGSGGKFYRTVPGALYSDPSFPSHDILEADFPGLK